MLIVCTEPDFFSEESELINILFAEGLERLHLRKPNCRKFDYENLLRSINQEFYPRIVIHDYHELALQYPLCGIHLNSRFPKSLENYSGKISRSLHSVSQLIAYQDKYDYVTLSPIFDSISKVGYQSAFTIENLQLLRNQGFINNSVIALGGINVENISTIKQLGFGGAMILGALWNFKDDRQKFLHIFRQIVSEI